MRAQPSRSPLWRSVLLAVLAAWIAAACGSSSISTTAPTSSKCQVTATTAMHSAPYAGANGSVAVATTRDCTWSANSSASWISITSEATGQGDGTVSFRVAPNADPVARRGSLSVNDASIDVSQEAAPCHFTAAASQTGVPAAGGSIRINVTASSSACTWTASSNVSWLAITQGTSGSGNGTVTIGVGTNTGDVREGSVVVAGETIVIRQDAAGTTTPPPAACTYTLTPPSQSIGAAGGPASIAVATNVATCPWDAQSDASWINFTTSSGTGTGTAAFSVATNSGGARTATLTIAGVTATVSQAAAACSFAIAPGSASFGSAGGTGSVSVTVTAGAGCAWTASENTSWISITSGASGTGNGTVSFSVAANSGGARSANMTIAGRGFSVTQDAAPCSYSISPSGRAVPASGGSGTFNMTARSGCTWSAASNADWITITSGSSGNGNGAVAFSAAANAGAARSGTITAGGQTFTVTQPAPCAYSIAPTSQPVPAAGGPGSVAVTAGGGCDWTATANVPWITISSGASGSGNGTVAFSVAANTAVAPRSGTLTIAGQTFTVNQDAAACTYSIAPTSQGVPAAGGAASTSVTASGGCNWTATSNAPWITVAAGASGSGNGTVSLTVAANPDSSPRSGTVTVAGQTFTVNQDAAACTFTIAPTNQNVDPGGGGGTVTVTTGPACSWTATSNNPDWLGVLSGASGTGNGSVMFGAAPNGTGAPRTGTLTIGGQTFTVNQGS